MSFCSRLDWITQSMVKQGLCRLHFSLLPSEAQHDAGDFPIIFKKIPQRILPSLYAAYSMLNCIWSIALPCYDQLCMAHTVWATVLHCGTVIFNTFIARLHKASALSISLLRNQWRGYGKYDCVKCFWALMQA